MPRKAISAGLSLLIVTGTVPPASAQAVRVPVAMRGTATAVPAVPGGLAAPLVSGGISASEIGPMGRLSALVPAGSPLVHIQTPGLSPAPAHLAAPAELAAPVSIVVRRAGGRVAGVRAMNQDARPSLTRRVRGLRAAARLDSAALKESGSEGSSGIARAGFARLFGMRLAGDSDAPVSARESALGAFTGLRAGPARLVRARAGAAQTAPETPAPAASPAEAPAVKKTLRWYLAGTGIYKIGMEALGLSVPLLALTVFGEVKWAAVLTVGYGLSQIVFSSLAGGLLDRRSPSKVISGAMALQAGTVAVLLSLFALDHFLPGVAGFPLVNPYTLLVLYGLAGGLLGVADTAKQVIPPEVIGNDERGIKLFNAKTHIAYEIAGVIGALATGVVISQFGLVWALIVHPPAYLIAAWAFSKIKMPARGDRSQALAADPDATRTSSGTGIFAALKRSLSDLKVGAQTVWSRPLFRWAAVALLVPLVLHRLLEGLLIPVAATSFLGAPHTAAWIIGASNFGELLGAVLLMRSVLSRDESKRYRSYKWVRLMALGMLGLWAFNGAPYLAVLLPLIAFGSMTWAASDLSLRSKLQRAFPAEVRGRSFGFLGAAAFALILATSLGLGFLMDAFARAPVFFGINAALTLLAGLLFYSTKFLKAKKTSSQVKDSK